MEGENIRSRALYSPISGKKDRNLHVHFMNTFITIL